MRNVEGFEWDENAFMFNKDLIESYNKDSNTRYFLKVDVQYPERLHKPCNDLLFLPRKRMKSRKNLRTLKQALNYGVLLKKVHKVIKFSQKAW